MSELAFGNAQELFLCREKTKTRVVYVCSPLRGDIEASISRAQSYFHDTFLAGCLPIAPHTMFTQFLNDGLDDERAAGMNMALQLLRLCDELWVFGERISEGMAGEIELALALSIPILYYEADCLGVSACPTGF